MMRKRLPFAGCEVDFNHAANAADMRPTTGGVSVPPIVPRIPDTPIIRASIVFLAFASVNCPNAYAACSTGRALTHAASSEGVRSSRKPLQASQNTIGSGPVIMNLPPPLTSLIIVGYESCPHGLSLL